MNSKALIVQGVSGSASTSCFGLFLRLAVLDYLSPLRSTLITYLDKARELKRSELVLYRPKVIRLYTNGLIAVNDYISSSVQKLPTRVLALVLARVNGNSSSGVGLLHLDSLACIYNYRLYLSLAVLRSSVDILLAETLPRHT